MKRNGEKLEDLKLRFTQANQQACLPANQITTKSSISRTSQQQFSLATKILTALSGLPQIFQLLHFVVSQI